jgi:hypothetical protein
LDIQRMGCESNEHSHGLLVDDSQYDPLICSTDFKVVTRPGQSSIRAETWG